MVQDSHNCCCKKPKLVSSKSAQTGRYYQQQVYHPLHFIFTHSCTLLFPACLFSRYFPSLSLSKVWVCLFPNSSSYIPPSPPPPLSPTQHPFSLFILCEPSGIGLAAFTGYLYQPGMDSLGVFLFGNSVQRSFTVETKIAYLFWLREGGGGLIRTELIKLMQARSEQGDKLELERDCFELEYLQNGYYISRTGWNTGGDRLRWIEIPRNRDYVGWNTWEEASWAGTSEGEGTMTMAHLVKEIH